MARTSTEESEHLSGAVVKQTSRGAREPRHGHVLLMFDQPAGNGDQRTTAESVMRALASKQTSATLTCFRSSGTPAVFRWDAGTKTVHEVEFPNVGITTFACFVSGGGHVMVALTCCDKDERLVASYLEQNRSQENVVKVLQRLALNGTALPRRGPLQPDLSAPSISGFNHQGFPVRLRACIHGEQKLKYLQMRPCARITVGGGYIMAIDGGFGWDPADTQLQLICGDIVIDRYDLTAHDIRAIHQESDERGPRAQTMEHTQASLQMQHEVPITALGEDKHRKRAGGWSGYGKRCQLNQPIFISALATQPA